MELSRCHLLDDLLFGWFCVSEEQYFFKYAFWKLLEVTPCKCTLNLTL